MKTPRHAAISAHRTALKMLVVSAFALTGPGLLKAAPGGDFAAVGEIRPVNGSLRGAASAQKIAIDTEQGDPGRILAQPGQSFSVQLALANARLGEPLRVSAGMGGIIDGKAGPLLRSRLGDPNVALTFTVGRTRGRYLLELQNGRDWQILEFWVGEEPPQGQPGPARTFSAPKP